MKRVFTVVLTMLLGMTLLAGCQTGSSALTGRYTMTNHILVDGTDITERYIESGFALDDQYLEFIDGENCVMHQLSIDINMTYSRDGNTINYFEENGLEHTGTIEGNTITLVYSGQDTFVFAKK
ncbi:MAG: hypothetical protein FWH50_01140 [Coriobacteriia bacterium]|nr:hypothetical protein [Coriobacteriia bacterium]